MTTIIMIAKQPVAGHVKTRLCPPLDPTEAARVAAACIADTMACIERLPFAARRVVALAGEDDGRFAGWDVVAQRGGGLDERLAHAFADVGPDPDERILLVGMDTPQVTVRHFVRALDALATSDAVLGPAEDGGFWLVGLRRPDPGAFVGVPMSTPHTGRAQCERLLQRGHSVAIVDALRDIDDIADARAIAARAPSTYFARTLRRILPARELVAAGLVTRT